MYWVVKFLIIFYMFVQVSALYTLPYNTLLQSFSSYEKEKL